MSLRILSFFSVLLFALLSGCNRPMPDKNAIDGEVFTLENCMDECATLGMEVDVAASNAGRQCRCKSVTAGVA